MEVYPETLSRVKKAGWTEYAFNVQQSCLEDGEIRNERAFRYQIEGKEFLIDIKNECDSQGLGFIFNECIKIKNADYRREERLKKRVEKMLLNGQCLFLTLTFNDKTLEKTTQKRRRELVQRFLKACNGEYVGNIDFGAKNGREHYHALIQAEEIDFSPWRKYGNINCERVRNRNLKTDTIKLAKYTSKITNHAIKETTRRSVLLYSRH